jgi:hypothetical protein
MMTTMMTTVRLPGTLNYATVELASCLATPSARAYGSEGWGFESLRARYQKHRFTCVNVMRICATQRLDGLKLPGLGEVGDPGAPQRFPQGSAGLADTDPQAALAALEALRARSAIKLVGLVRALGVCARGRR